MSQPITKEEMSEFAKNFRHHDIQHMKPIAWYDPSNGAVSTDKDSPLFTPLGQLWPLYSERPIQSTAKNT